MKNRSFIKLFALLLAILMLVPVFAACDEETTTAAPDNNDANNNNTNEQTKPEHKDGYVYLAERGESTFSVVHSKDAVVLTANEADLLAKDMLTWTDAILTLVDDGREYTHNEIIIGVVGAMGRPELEAFAASYNLGLDDYVIKMEKGDLIVACGSKEASVAAAEFLRERILIVDEANKTVCVPADLHYVMRYDMKNATGGLKRIELDNMGEKELLFTVNPHSEKDVPVRVTYSGNGGWRVQTKYSLSEQFNDIGAAQLMSVSCGEEPAINAEPLKYWKSGENIFAEAPDKTYVILNTETFSLKFCNADGTLCRTMTKINHTILGQRKTLTLAVNFSLNETEAIFGSGERFDSVNQRGKKIIVQSGSVSDDMTNPYVAVPLFASSRGSGLFINNNGYMTADIGAAKANEMSFELSSGNIDCYVFVTDEIADVIDNYSAISGYAKMPENWTYGLLVCRYDGKVNTKEAVAEIVAKTEAYNIPWTGIVIDGWDISDFERHEELREVCDMIHAMGKKVICNLNVGMMPEGKLPDEFAISDEDMEGFLLGWSFKYIHTSNDSAGNWSTSTEKNTTTQHIPVIPTAGDMITTPLFVSAPITTNNPATCNPFLTKIECGDRTDNSDDVLYETRTFIDITNPTAVEWFFGKYWDYLVNDIGLDGAKVDGTGIMPDALGTLNFYDSTIPSGGARAWYPTYFTSLLYDVLAAKPDSGVCFIRGGGIGAQRNSYIWGGDQSRTINRLQRQIRGLLSAGLSGIPFVTYDIGGSFYKNGMDMDIDKEAKIVLRAAQFSIFTAAMQTTDTDVRGIFDFEEEDASYAYVTELYSAYTRMHSALQPYIEEYAEEATKTGMPLARHLILSYQNDKNVIDLEDEYLFGDAFLVAPELYGNTSRKVYLPEGKWMNLMTGEEYTVGAEGKTIECNVTIAEIPVFYNMNTTSKTAADVLLVLQGLIEDVQEIEIP